jgi:hypothetical protein
MVVGEIVGVVRDVAGGGSEATRWRRGVFIFPLVLTAAAAGAPWMSSSSSKSVAGVACWCPSLRQFAMMLRPQAPQSCHAPPPPPIVVVEILHCQPEPHANVAGEAEGGSGTSWCSSSTTYWSLTPPEQGKGGNAMPPPRII